MLQGNRNPFRCIKFRVPNIGGTPPYSPLKSTNKTIFFYFQDSDFSGWLFILYTKFQQLNFVLKFFQRFWNLQKKYVEKLKALHRVCLKTVFTKIFIFLVFFVQKSSGGRSWKNKCTNFQETCYTTNQPFSDALKLEF